MRKFMLMLVVGGLAVGLTATSSFAISDFQEVFADANGDYLWTEPSNWGGDGLPDSTIIVYMSGWSPATATVYGAGTAMNIRGSKESGASGSALNIRDGGSVTITGDPNPEPWMGFLVCEKGDVDLRIEGSGSLTLLASGTAGSMYIDGDGGKAYLANAVLAGGTLNVGGTLGWGVNQWSKKLGTCDGSVLDVQGGVISVTDNLYVGSGDPGNPGVFKISGAASISTGGSLLMFEALLEIDGGDATINTTGIRLKRSGTDGSTTLKLTGSGVSTINASGTATLNAGALLDVSGLTPGDYKVIDAGSIVDNGLAFAAGTDSAWSFTVDAGGSGDLDISYAGGRIMGDVNLSGLVDDDDLSLLLANWNIGDEWGKGDLNENGTVNDDDLSLLLANWGADGSAAPEAVPEPMTLGLLAIGGLGVLLRRKK